MGRSRDEQTTSEMRHDWLTDRWVIIAPHRNGRPVEFVRQPSEVVPSIVCPFCYGNECETPNAVASYSLDTLRSNSSRWQVRVVPNKFPAVQAADIGHSAARLNYIALELANELKEASSGLWTRPRITSSELFQDESYRTDNQPSSQTLPSVNLYHKRDLSGGHEVIIEAPDHFFSLSQLDKPATTLVFQAYRDRLNHWLVERELAYAVVFKNVGQDAGASLVHTHSQVIATDIVPTDVARVATRMETFYAQEGECLLCRTIADEHDQQIRLVEETRDFMAYCPFASRLPSLVTIAPKHHSSQFELLDSEQLGQLSWLVHRLVRRIEYCHPQAAYNYVIYTAPHCHQSTPWFHWRIELFPRLSTLAGFELGSECYINPITPEIAAKALKIAEV